MRAAALVTDLIAAAAGGGPAALRRACRVDYGEQPELSDDASRLAVRRAGAEWSQALGEPLRAGWTRESAAVLRRWASTPGSRLPAVRPRSAQPRPGRSLERGARCGPQRLLASAQVRSQDVHGDAAGSRSARRRRPRPPARGGGAVNNAVRPCSRAAVHDPPRVHPRWALSPARPTRRPQLLEAEVRPSRSHRLRQGASSRPSSARGTRSGASSSLARTRAASTSSAPLIRLRHRQDPRIAPFEAVAAADAFIRAVSSLRRAGRGT